MKKLSLLLASLLALPALASASSSLDQDLLQKSANKACSRIERANLGLAGECTVSGLQRRSLGGGIAEYTFLLRTGAGPFDAIGLHRVVREEAPFRPMTADRSVFLTHGDLWGFDAAFLADPAHAFPVFLAQNGVDVWGIDLGWTRVPGDTTDFSFMQGWGVERDARDVALGVSVARAARVFTGNSFDRMPLLGWSRGGIIGYAVVNAETQLPPGQRNVSAYIPVDTYLKTNDESLRQAACNRVAADRQTLAGGGLQNANGQLVQLIGTLATVDPASGSPIFPGLTNYQAALLTGEATFVIFPPDQQIVPFYHFTGGTFEPQPNQFGLPVPTGLSYSPEATWVNFLLKPSPFQPTQELLDSDIAQCNVENVAFDDHLGQITVPVLYVGAGGGFGELGVYTTTLLGSTDVTTHIVDLTPDRLSDFGHADLFLGNDAQALVWQPILTWLQAH
jgi:hypothetical protein